MEMNVRVLNRENRERVFGNCEEFRSAFRMRDRARRSPVQNLWKNFPPTRLLLEEKWENPKKLKLFKAKNYLNLENWCRRWSLRWKSEAFSMDFTRHKRTHASRRWKVSNFGETWLRVCVPASGLTIVSNRTLKLQREWLMSWKLQKTLSRPETFQMRQSRWLDSFLIVPLSLLICLLLSRLLFTQTYTLTNDFRRRLSNSILFDFDFRMKADSLSSTQSTIWKKRKLFDWFQWVFVMHLSLHVASRVDQSNLLPIWLGQWKHSLTFSGLKVCFPNRAVRKKIKIIKSTGRERCYKTGVKMRKKSIFRGNRKFYFSAFTLEDVFARNAMKIEWKEWENVAQSA